MRYPGFIGPSYIGPDHRAEYQRTINFYLEIDESGGSPHGEKGYLIGTPGTAVECTLGDGPIRCVFTSSTGQLFAASGSDIYSINDDFSSSIIGHLETGFGVVAMADNGSQLLVVDGVSGYIFQFSTSEFSPLDKETFPGSDCAVFQDGYFVCNNPGTGQFFISGLYDGFTWDQLDFATAEGQPDNLIAVISDRRQLWMLGSATIETWFNSGAGEYPFSRIEGAFIEYGCIAAASALKYVNTIVWVGSGKNAQGVVWMAEGYIPKRISDHSVERIIQASTDIAGITAWTYQDKGHIFYCLNIPGAETTWCYDIATGKWCERAYFNGGVLERHRASCSTIAYDKVLVGDYQNGNIYRLDDSVYTDNGGVLKSVRIGPRFAKSMKRLFFKSFELDARFGVGLDGNGYGSEPMVDLSWSDDGGQHFNPPLTRSMGKIGEFSKRAIWRQLGVSRQRNFKLEITSPVARKVFGAEVDVAEGLS